MEVYCFESYGVRVRIDAATDELLERAVAVAQKSLLGRLTAIQPSSADHLISLRYRRGKIWMIFDGEDEGDAISEMAWLNYFDTRIRLLIGEYAPDYVFLHSGAVAWRGKAILLPGDSFTGKSTLVTELLRRGADYLSDEYAVLDAEANVHAFPRPISRRPADDPGGRYFITPESVGANVPLNPIPPVIVVLTQYKPRARWSPSVMSPGQAILEIIPHALSIRSKTRITLLALKRLSERAILVRSLRGGAVHTSQKLVDFVDKATS